MEGRWGRDGQRIQGCAKLNIYVMTWTGSAREILNSNGGCGMGNTKEARDCVLVVEYDYGKGEIEDFEFTVEAYVI